MGRKKKGRTAKKAMAGQIGAQEEQFRKAPHTMVFNRGQVGKNVKQLMKDTRRVMEPYTASNLRARKKNTLKDFIGIAGPLNVSHFLTFSKSDVSTNLRLMRLPRGPTMTFKVDSYSLHRDIISSLKRHNMEPKQFQHHPLLVMNNFSGEGRHLQLMATMFQNMFPSINVNKVKLNDIRRCVLLNYNAESKTVDFRHYNIRAVPVGMSRGVKKLIRAKVPNMSRYEDVSEYLLKGGNLSESEAEMDGPHNEVFLPQQMSSRGNMKAAKSAVRLTEIGPRMTLQLVKIQEGICSGDVLYHGFVTKTEEELKAATVLREKKKKMKEQRKKKQQENLQKNQAKKEEIKKKAMAGMKKKQTEDSDSGVEETETKGGTGDNSEMESEDETQDDITYYKQEVGEAPDPELFPHAGGLAYCGKGRKRKRTGHVHVPFKKRKASGNKNTKTQTQERFPKRDQPQNREKRTQKMKDSKKTMNKKQMKPHVKTKIKQHGKTKIRQGGKPKDFKRKRY